MLFFRLFQILKKRVIIIIKLNSILSLELKKKETYLERLYIINIHNEKRNKEAVQTNCIKIKSTT